MYVFQVNQYLKQCKYPVSHIEDVAFERARKYLEAKNKQLKKEGKGNRANAAEALSDDEINSNFLQKNLLGISNGEALINTLGSSIHCILVYEDVESIGKCETGRFNWINKFT